MNTEEGIQLLSRCSGLINRGSLSGILLGNLVSKVHRYDLFCLRLQLGISLREDCSVSGNVIVSK